MTTHTQAELLDLQQTVKAFLHKESPPSQVRAATAGFDRALWHQVVELGWASLMIPETFGGLGWGHGAALRLLVEAGRRTAPVPLLSSGLLAPTALAEASATIQERWLPRLADGSAVGTVALTGRLGRPGAGNVNLDGVWDDGGWRLTGTAGFVPDAGSADLLVVAADVDSHLDLFVLAADTPGLTVTEAPTWDITRQFGHLKLEAVQVPAEARLESAGLYQDLLGLGAAAVACDSLGATEEALQTTVAYGQNRVQFNRVIGSFQAWKHRAANLFIQTQTAAAAVRGAERAYDQSCGVRRASSAAKFLAADAGVAVTEDCIQLLGGIGYTWDSEAHLYLKRNRINQVIFGDSAYHRDIVAGELARRHEELNA